MAQTTLVMVDFQKSEKIVSALEKDGIRIAVAMWTHFPEYEYWRLVLASKDLDKDSLGDAYLRLYRVLDASGMTVLNTPQIHLMKTTDPFIRALRKVFRNAESVEGMRLGGQRWGDRFVDDAYAYKIA